MTQGGCLPGLSKEVVDRCVQQNCPGQSLEDHDNYSEISSCTIGEEGNTTASHPIEVTRREFDLSFHALVSHATL